MKKLQQAFKMNNSMLEERNKWEINEENDAEFLADFNCEYG